MGEPAPGAPEPVTIVDVLWRRAKSSPGQLAIIENDRGRWTPTTAGELAERVVSLAVGLAAAGVTSGRRVANLVGSRAAWVEVDLAVQCAGGVSVAVPNEEDDEALARLLDRLDVFAVVVSDPVTLQRLGGLVDAERLGPIPLVLQLGPTNDGTLGLDELVEDGRRIGGGEARRLDEQVRAMAPDDDAIATFTSGAGGRPRPIVQTSRAALAAARQVVEARGLHADDVGVVALDPSHPFERAVTIYPALASGAVLAFAESESTIARATFEVQPTFAHVPVETLREAAAGLAARFRRNRGVKRLIARSWRRTAARGRPPSAAARLLIGRPALRSLGWGHVRSLLVTSTSVPANTAAAIGALGVDVHAGYAIVEAGGLVGISTRGRPFTALAGLQVSSVDGQLVVRGPGLGVRCLDGAPSDVHDGTLRTGDLGSADGRTFAVDGPAASMIGSDGGPLLATAVEGRLRESPYVVSAVVSTRGGAPHAEVEIDRAAVGAWAGERGLHFTTYSSLVGRDEVGSLIAAEVARLAPEVMSHDLLQRPLQQGRDITRTRTTVHRRHQPGDADDAPTAHTEPASTLE